MKQLKAVLQFFTILGLGKEANKLNWYKMCKSPITIGIKKPRVIDGVSLSNRQAVPCGKCTLCTKRRISDWLIRWTYELERSNRARFVTLTYDGGHVPKVTTEKIDKKTGEITEMKISTLRKKDPFDYYVKSLAQVGEQPVLNKELYYTGVPDQDNDIFGYLPPFSDYRTRINEVHGDFRESIDYYVYADNYVNLPLLNKQIIEQDSSTPKSLFYVNDLPNDEQIRDWNVLYCHFLNTIEADRKVPMYGEPAKLV